jgi:CheY-like chemotaxis protein
LAVGSHPAREQGPHGSDPEAEGQGERGDTPSPDDRPAPRTVLVVDDERDIETLFGMWFRREVEQGTLQLRFAFNGADALEELSSDPKEIVLILSDVNMPGMSGLDLLAAIRALPNDLPVYMITGYGRDTEREALSLGATGFLTKPLDRGLLREILGA